MVEHELDGLRCKMPMGYTACLVKGDYNFVELEPPHGVDYLYFGVNHAKL